jgi:glycosyltransferase involved in cell wall biosynthesis
MVNDCAFVGETLIKYLPSFFNVVHIKRTRRFFDKTFGVFWKILRCTGDLYHVHYLFQDCYLALKCRKHPLVGHAHGSDLRETLHSKKWGRLVRYALQECDKVLVAQPTLLGVAKAYNNTADYFPTPYDPEIFYPKPLFINRKVKQILLASPHNFRTKGTDKFLHALSLVKIPLKIKTIGYGKDVEKSRTLAKKFSLNMEFVKEVPHSEMNKLYWSSDLVLGSFGVGQLDTIAIEAMACGRPVVHHLLKRFYPQCPFKEINSVEECAHLIEKFLTDEKTIKKQVETQIIYVQSVHTAPLLAKKLAGIYENLMKDIF